MTDPRARASSPWRAVAVLLAAMVLAGGLIVGVRAVVAGGPEPGPAPTTAVPSPSDSVTDSPTPTPSPTGPLEQTLLLQARDDEGLAVGNVLLGSRLEPEAGYLVAVPPRLLVDPPGGPQTVFEATALGTNSALSQQTLSDLLGVRIDATWTLDRLALAGLVDSIGGIYLDVAAPVVIRGADGTVLVRLTAGINGLDGPTAASYALVRQPGEPESARQARFEEVVRQILLRIPEERSRVELVLGSLGALSRTTVPVDELSGLLLRMRGHIDRNRYTRESLPVTAVALGVARADRLDFVRAETMMAADFAASRLEPGPDVPVRVLVTSGVARAGLAVTARPPLESAGYVYLSGGSAPRQGYTESLVVVPADAAGAAQWAAGVAKALRLPATAVRLTADPRTTADVVVILGADYRPLTPPSPEPTLSPEPTTSP